MSDRQNAILARDLYLQVKDLPIVSPHGHCDPHWWVEDAAFPDPADLLITPDHYIFRMLYSHGVQLESLGIGKAPEDRDGRAIFQILANHWHCFLGTPSREWMEYTLKHTLGVATELSPETSDLVYDEIAEKLNDRALRPRALFDRFKIEVLATTDVANDDLGHHAAIASSQWNGRIIPTFRPDAILNPQHKAYAVESARLAELTGKDTSDPDTFLQAVRLRRSHFIAHGATATDHDVPFLMTQWLDRPELERLHHLAARGRISPDEARRYYGHMLIEMAQMSIEDGLVMQLHVGSRRNTNRYLFNKYGPDMGADIPTCVNWVKGLDGLLNKVGNDPGLRILLFTLDESSYARELAPMAGHWPCLRLGPPWWFHDSVNGMRRYFDQLVETAGYFNLAGFNDDTRAFLSIPARHNTWRRAAAIHLAEQVDGGRLTKSDAQMLAPRLCRDLALDAYRLTKSEF